MDKLKSMEDLYLHELKDLHSAESQLAEALPKMAEAANSDELKSAFKDHIETTKRQLDRLDSIFDKLGQQPGGHKCKAMAGLIEEGEELLKQKSSSDPDVFDAGLIAAAQRVEHYEMAGYGCAVTYADILGQNDASQLLNETLSEEKNTDERLNKLAKSGINRRATA